MFKVKNLEVVDLTNNTVEFSGTLNFELNGKDIEFAKLEKSSYNKDLKFEKVFQNKINLLNLNYGIPETIGQGLNEKAIVEVLLSSLGSQENEEEIRSGLEEHYFTLKESPYFSDNPDFNEVKGVIQNSLLEKVLEIDKLLFKNKFDGIDKLEVNVDINLNKINRSIEDLKTLIPYSEHSIEKHCFKIIKEFNKNSPYISGLPLAKDFFKDELKSLESVKDKDIISILEKENQILTLDNEFKGNAEVILNSTLEMKKILKDFHIETIDPEVHEIIVNKIEEGKNLIENNFPKLSIKEFNNIIKSIDFPASDNPELNTPINMPGKNQGLTIDL